MLRQWTKNAFYGCQRRVARVHSRLATGSGALPLDRFTIFNLHAVNPAPGDMAVSETNLRAQLAGLLEAGYRCMDMQEALDLAAAGGAMPHAAFVLTFDDGYRSVYENFFPILRDLNLSATLFLTVNFLGGEVRPPWKSQDKALLREYGENSRHFQPLEWFQVREMVASGKFRIGSHTLSHELLGFLDDRRLRREVRDSKAALEDRFGVPVSCFSYPFGVRSYGAYTERTEAEVHAAGYRCSVTAEVGRARAGMEPRLLPRISLVNADTAADACAKAAGAYDWVGVAQRSFQRVFPNPHRHPHEDAFSAAR